MNVLVAFECSGRVRDAFRKLGHNAWSCDLKPAEDGSDYHIQHDAIKIIRDGCYLNSRKARTAWGMVIAHPPCPRMCLSGVLRLYIDGKKKNGRDPVKWAEMIAAARLFRAVFDAHDGLLGVENPRQHGYALAEHGCGIHDQVIQPYEFGDDASKATCLWLRGLPPLIATHTRDPDLFAAAGPQPRFVGRLPRYSNQTDSGQNKLAPSPTRSCERAVTYAGVAKAMASQWGDL